MSAGIKSSSSSVSDNIIDGLSLRDETKESIADPQVKPKKQYTPRRYFKAAYKKQILLAYDACETPSERGALLRKEGLYYSRITAWKKEAEHSKINGSKKQSTTLLRSDHLMRENEQLRKKLHQVEAIVELQKKVSDFLGMHILPQENSELKS